MSDNSEICVFCRDQTFDKVIKFTAETIKKCKTVLEYRQNKMIKRKSRTSYNKVEIPDETSFKDGYHAQCYKLFTAIKIPPDFQKPQKSEAECDNALQVSGDSKIYFSDSSSTTQVAGTIRDEPGVSNESEHEFEDSGDQFCAVDPLCDEVLPPVKCFICERARKRHRGREVPLAVNRFRTIDLIKSAATEHCDIVMLKKLSSFSKHYDIPYHKCCKDQYLRTISKGDESDFLKKRKASNTAYVMLCQILEEYCVENNEGILFDAVKKEYHNLLIEQCKLLSDSINSSSFSDRYLERKIMDTFKKKIKIICKGNQKFLVPFSALQ
ncbi:uncharacterized protein LOC106721668 [Papilio machaon]|uniref:uncharacterized protein LOC106721668 n=1 Tax=Papilio machaon TaxID=76193 RepID=UPI001E66484C|nr:uncharacterized protein LOC106721668 [Papilio machaon]